VAVVEDAAVPQVVVALRALVEVHVRSAVEAVDPVNHVLGRCTRHARIHTPHSVASERARPSVLACSALTLFIPSQIVTDYSLQNRVLQKQKRKEAKAEAEAEAEAEKRGDGERQTVGVDDVEEHRDAVAVRRIDEPLERVRIPAAALHTQRARTERERPSHFRT
jgi:hypothetical protein